MKISDTSHHREGYGHRNKVTAKICGKRLQEQHCNMNLSAEDTQVDPEADGSFSSQIRSDGTERTMPKIKRLKIRVDAYSSQLQFSDKAVYSVDKGCERTELSKVQTDILDMRYSYKA